MSEPTVDRDPFEVVAESFLARFRAGERPSVEEYADRHPELASQIRELLPALVMVEQDLTINTDPGPAGERPHPVPAPDKERRLGDYRILREIGRGGMGVVYEAEQLSLNRRVALKVLPGQVAGDRQALERFRREARSAARLHHTNIVPVFEVGRDGEAAYYAMQFIQGQGLDQVIKELAGLRDTEGNSGKADGPGTTEAATATGVRKPALGRVAESLLGDRFPTEAAVPSTDIPPAVVTGPAATNRLARDATRASDFILTDPEPAGLGPTTAPGPSALLSGGSLVSTSHRSGRRAPFFRSVAQIGRQAAQGLAYAHSRGIVHRDIKPSNLLLDHTGVVWIADFGLAKGEDEGLTHTGDILGTIRYMAPERFRGEGDARADVYALGLTLYELLTLRPGFDSSDRLRLIEQIKTEEPQKPRSVDARIPRDLETIVLKAIEKDPKARYQSAEALGEDLGRFLADEPIRARQVSASERYWRWARRNPAIAVLGGVLTGALVLGTLVSTYFALRANQKAVEAQTNARQATQEMQRANLAAKKAIEEAARADQEAQRARDEKLLSDHRLYPAEIHLARQAWQEGRPDLVQQHLKELEPKRPEDPDLRGFEWYYLRRTCQSDLILHGSTSVAYSPDGRRITGGSMDGMVRVWDAVTGQEVHALRGHRGSVLDVSYSPDGRILASASHDHTVKLWDAATGREVRTLRGHTAKVVVVSYSPDGRTLASAGDDGIVRLWDAATGQMVQTMSGHTAPVQSVSYSPDGRTLASASHDSSVRVWNVATGQLVRTLSGHGTLVWGVAYSPDGRTLATARDDQTVGLWDAATGHERLTLRGHSSGVYDVAFSPDGLHLASASSDRTVKIWDATTGQDLRTLPGQETHVSSVSYSPDGRRIAAAGSDETVRLWYISADQEAIILRGHVKVAIGVSYSPDGRTLASSGVDRTVRIWDAATGQELRTLRGHTAVVWGVSYSPDGRTLASASFDHTVKIWDAATGREVQTLRGHTAKVMVVSHSPDGRTLASSGVDRTVRIWDAATGREVHCLHGHTDQVNRLAYSPDGRTLASVSSDRTIRIWNAATGQIVHTLRGHSGLVDCVAYSPDGDTLASASSDRTIRIWNAATGQIVRTMLGQSVLVHGVAYTPDGHTLASAGDDGTVKLWDAATGQELLTLRGHVGSVFGVAFSPDGRVLASSCNDRTVRLWDATPLTYELQATREARGVVESLFAQSKATAEVLASIRQDATASAEVRQRALVLAESYRHSLMTREAESLVESLYDKAMFRPDVLASLRTDVSLSEPVRRLALALAEQIPENPDRLEEASRAVLREPDAEPAACRLALRQAQAACRLVPNEADFLSTLGMACYRLGQYEEAVAALTQADRIHTDNWNGVSFPGDLAFLALSRHRLCQTELARSLLSRLHDTMKGHQWALSREVQGFLREAQVIELEFVLPADPFAHEPVEKSQ